MAALMQSNANIKLKKGQNLEIQKENCKSLILLAENTNAPLNIALFDTTLNLLIELWL